MAERVNNLEYRRPLVTAVCLAVPILALFSAINSYSLSVESAKASPDSVGLARARSRFAPAIARVPAAEQVGYLTDLDPASALHASEYMAVQYALAPRELLLLGQSRAPTWAVGNFSKPQDYASAGSRLGYELVADLGNGVVLFRRKGS